MTETANGTAAPAEAAAKYPRNPWKSLNFYTEQDRDIFFGRKEETENLFRLLQRDQLTIVFGRSGLGKTSLLRAGVMPLLRRESFLPVIKRVVYSPLAASPVHQIKEELLKQAAAAGVDVEEVGPPARRKEGELEETLWELFHRCRFWGPRNDPVLPVLILDQFEEVFTLGRQGRHTGEFLEQLGDLVENRMPAAVKRLTEESGERLSFDTRAQNYRVVLSLREDFVPKLDSLSPTIPSVMRNRFELKPLSRQQAVEVVLGAGKMWISAEVARQIVAVVAGEGKLSEEDPRVLVSDTGVEPAYLSVMCYELFERMKENDAGLVDAELVAKEQRNILDGMYERSFIGVEQKTRIFIEDGLVTPSGFRGTVPLAEVEQQGVPAADLEKLVNRRILRYEERLGTTHVELSHDLLTGIVKKSRDAREAAAQQEANRRREEQFLAQLRRSRRQVMMAASLALVLVAGMVFYFFGWVRPYSSYSRSFTKQRGVIHPVGLLPRSAVAHRAWTLKLTKNGWFGDVIRMVEVVDSNGRQTPNHPIKTYLADWGGSDLQERPSKYEFIYGPNDQVAYEIASDRFGRRVWSFIYVPGDGQSQKQTRGFYVDSEGYPRAQRRSRAEIVEISYDDRGYEAKRVYRDRRGNPAQGPNCAYGVSIVYDDKGREIRETSLDDQGRPMNDEVGNASMQARYDADGNITAEYAYDANGERTLLLAGWHSIELRYDKWGQEIDRRYFGLSGEPVVDDKEFKAHRVKSDYDDGGHLRSVKLFGVDGKPVVAGGEGFHFPAHEMRMSYDRAGLLETVSYFDKEGKPITGSDGWHGQRYQYDRSGFVRVVSSFDVHRAPFREKNGVCRAESVNDQFGRAVEVRFFDEAGRPVAGADGYHLVKKQYDRAGNTVLEAYFDASGRPAADVNTGVYRIAKSFDPFGNCRFSDFFDGAGAPVNCRQGYHREENEYDRFGSTTSTRWLDKDGRAVNGPNGVQWIKKSYDPRSGLITREERCTANGAPALGLDGIYEILYAHNGKRQETRRQYFAFDKKPVEDLAKNHLIEREFDERGRPTSETRLRADGSGNWDHELGVATEKKVYNRENKWVEQAYYDTGAHLVVGPYGYAKGVMVYRPDGGMEFYNYGPDGKFMYNPLIGYAVAKLERQKGDGRLSFYGPDGRLMIGQYGFAEKLWRQDEKGQILAEAWYDTEERPMIGPGGYHSSQLGSDGKRKYYDVQNREIQRLGLDEVVPVLYIDQIDNMHQVEAMLHLRAGDIFWTYGRWSLPDVLLAARTQGASDPDEMLDNADAALFAEKQSQVGKTTRLIVIRDGRPVKVEGTWLTGLLFALNKKQYQRRLVPTASFRQWNLAVRRMLGEKGPDGWGQSYD